MTNDKCKDLIYDAGYERNIEYNNTVPNTMICAGGKNGKTGCNVSNESEFFRNS